MSPHNLHLLLLLFFCICKEFRNLVFSRECLKDVWIIHGLTHNKRMWEVPSHSQINSKFSFLFNKNINLNVSMYNHHHNYNYRIRILAN